MMLNFERRADSVRSRNLARLRGLSRVRRWLALAVLCCPTLAVVASDAVRRGQRLENLQGHYRWTYLGSVAESLALWSVLLIAACRQRGRFRILLAALFVIAATFSFGGQTYFYQQYSAYLNVDVSLFASNFMDSVVNQLFADFSNYMAAKIPPALVAVLLLWLGRKSVRPRRRRAMIASVLAPLFLVASFFIPTQHRHVQAATPDVLYMHAVGGLLRTQLGLSEQSGQLRPRTRNSMPVAALSSVKRRPPNVLLIILESVRADSVCVGFDANCRRTERTNFLLKERYPLTQMRSLASSTAISLAVLWAGVGPHESRDVLHEWPLIFDYAKKAGYQTAFWTSQNMMFGNSRLWVENLGVDKFCSATELDPTSDLDMGAPEQFLADRVNREMTQLSEPFLAVVQLSNTHYPYWVNPTYPEPFQPATTSKAPEDNPYFKNYYQNSVYQQDLHVARIIEQLKSRPEGQRTVIIYTSDHGEAFREHGQMGHTFSIFDEEIKVPGWVDAPPGTLSDTERANLRAKRKAYTFHVDIAPTILDLIGVWDLPEIAMYKAKMLGTSLLRSEVTRRPLPMTNCAGVWSCAFENWGVMQQSVKLEARSWDQGYRCFDLSQDPLEQNPLQAPRCQRLQELAYQTFGRLPGQKSD